MLSKRSMLCWFLCGVVLAGVFVGILSVRDIAGLSSTDYAAALILGILATVQFGIIMPATCVYLRYKSDSFNFFHVFVLLLGFTVGTGAVVTWYGYLFLAFLYVIVSGGTLSGLYLLTCMLHKKMEEPPTKNRP